jgi:hypothetical protein
MARWMDGWMDGWMDWWMDWWMDGGAGWGRMEQLVEQDRTEWQISKQLGQGSEAPVDIETFIR